MKSNEEYVILRRTIFNGTVIEEDRFMGTAPTKKQADDIASLFEDDVKKSIHALKGVGFKFYVRVYEN